MSGADVNVTGSNVVADKDVNVNAGGNLNVQSAEQTSESEYIKKVKKSGLLSGGFGFTIGKEKQKDQYANQNSEQAGSTIGSIEGSVRLEAGKDADIKGSDVIAKENIDISGENVNIENTTSVYNAQEKHEFERSGLSVSIGGEAIDIVNSAVDHIERANDVEDKRLAALHGYKAIEDVTKTVNKDKQLLEKGYAESQWDKLEKAAKDPANNLSLNVSLGSSKSKSESSSKTIVANESNVKAGGDVNITATEKDINIKGSNVEGKNVNLNTKENLNITASENTNITKQDSKSSSGSLGVTVGAGGLQGINAGYSKSQGNVKENSTTYNESTVTANKNLDFTSGSDTNIQGGKLSGEKVSGNVSGDLNIVSKQDSNSYEEHNSSAGIGIGISVNGKDVPNKTGVFGSVGKSEIDSKYDSVTEQSGIYAGKDGFDIRVENNTDLKGGIITSEAEAEKNKISTGTLTFEDIKNKAEYEAGSIGVNIDTGKDAEKKDAGITPNIGMPASGEAESTTKATISDATIEIRDKENQKQDISKLNRDTQNSLNKLGEIFDKTKIEERQELAGLFGELAYKAVGDLAIKNGWEEGSAEKNALHALIGGIMSELGGSGFLAGASGAMINEMIQDKLSDMFEDDPAMHQWASALVGGVVSEIVANNAHAGASTAASATKNNYLTHKQYLDYKKELADCNGDPEKEKAVREKYEAIDALQDYIWLEMNNESTQGATSVGVDLNGDEVILTPGMNLVKGDETIRNIIDSTDLNNQILEMPNGSIYYIDEKGVLYQAYEGKALEKAIVESSKLAIKADIIPDPKKMTTDYVYSYVGGGISKTLSINLGYILDKQGNVYIFDQEQSGAGAAPPVYVGYGKGTIDTNWKNTEGNNIINAISGNSSSIGVSNIVSSSVSVSEDSMILVVEIGVETSAGITLSRRHARKVGNIYE